MEDHRAGRESYNRRALTVIHATRARPRVRVLLVYGTRPEAIKLAPVLRELRARPAGFETLLCASGQHREMLAQVHDFFGFAPDFDLDLMRPGQALNALASAVFRALDPLLERLRPDWLLVQGDTTTAMAAGFAAFHRRVRVGHVEAGLRTGDLEQPFPEEANRTVLDLLASALFAPTAQAVESLRAAGIPPQRVFLTGNTVVDALAWARQVVPPQEPVEEVLITLHRRESFGEPLRQVCLAVRELAARFPQVTWLLPVHPNPEVSTPVRALLGELPNVRLREPLGYGELISAMLRCRLILTDSGGIQEEASVLGKPVLVLREKTERPDGVRAGVALLVGTDRERIVDNASRLLSDAAAARSMSGATDLYGDGHAARRIVDILEGFPA